MIGDKDKSEPSAAGAEPTIPPDSDLIIHQSDLLPGDVLLYRPRNFTNVQRAISKATGSPYTHAAVYLGDGVVAESNVPLGVGKRALTESIGDYRCVAVLRSQSGFQGDRPQKLRAFVDDVLANKRLYNFNKVLCFKSRSDVYFNSQLDFIRENYGKVTARDKLAKQAFFCSAFVVACYTVVGIIGESAQVAYQPNNFSPGHLHQDPTFGWLLGFLVPEGGSVPADDPVLTQATYWRDVMGARWWP
ncbi:hypothetical protein [Phreatobacter oligotrophus]|uniref:hypothetical protein n=1 Tax=Phreatobacter oligotrophus TaxID=1122261 RepID=UPI002357CA2C|nr:hypothetical protein [Phreatobacter oligotrophus]MBX9989351.1 hypothetical protein [Phreatobacter oligotrophus]